MARVEKLDDEVIKQIKAYLGFSSIYSIVEQLLKASLQQHPTAVSIKIDLTSLSVFLQDNGDGYTPQQLEQLACFDGKESVQAQSQPKHSKLAVIGKVSDFFIVSKSTSFNCAHTIKLRGENPAAMMCDPTGSRGNHFAPDPIANYGSIYQVSNLFKNLPVRRKQFKNTQTHKIIDSIKVVILKLLLEKSDIDLRLSVRSPHSLRFEECCHVKASPHSYKKLLSDIFDLDLDYKSINAEYKTFKVSGEIGLWPINSKAHQYVFVNDMLVPLSRSFAKFINEMFVNSGFIDLDQETSPKKTTRKAIRKFPCFLIKIVCTERVDIKESSYSWTIITNIITKIFGKFLHLGNGERDKKVANKPLDCSPSPTKRKREAFILKSSSRWGHAKDSELESLVHSRKKTRRVISQFTPLAARVETAEPAIPANLCHDFGPQHEEVDFKKEILAAGDYRVIRQIDSKFILLLLRSQENQLIVLDQHASDERVKVESLIRDFVERMSNNPGLRLATPIIVQISTHELQLFKQYRSNFELFGICYETEMNAVEITKLPEPIITRVADDPDLLKDALLQHCYDLHNGVKSKTVRRDDDDWFEVSRHLPRVILEILNSRACRSAIMFGDVLSHEEMTELVESLSKCRLPFQCAHGRPSVVPLAKFSEKH